MFFRIFLPLVALTSASFCTIVIDPGHGGMFPGKKGLVLGLVEKDITLDVSKRLAELLRKNAFSVVLTRTQDSHFSTDHLKDLHERTSIAAKHKATLFLSIHCNFSTNQSIKGYELYVPYCSSFQQGSYLLASYAHHEFSKNLAFLKDGLLGNLNALDRGIRAARFVVLVSAPCPALLIELGYLSNRQEEAQLAQPAYRQKLATLLFNALVAYSENNSANSKK